jgi:hypothetical protein
MSREWRGAMGSPQASGGERVLGPREKERMTKQSVEHFTIRSLAGATRRRDGCAWGWVPRTPLTEQTIGHFKIRSVSDGCAWGWGPTRSK